MENPMNPFVSNVESLALEYLKTNPSANAPYHNNAHMQKVASIAGALWQHEQVEFEFDSIWAETVLMLAALFHDYGHSQGKESDSVNVSRARGCAKIFVSEHVPTMSVSALKVLDAAIECTEYPFIIAPRNKLEEVLRDADLLYATVSGDPSIIMEGLRKEIEVSLDRPVSYEEMAKGQVEFLGQQTMFTATAREYWMSEIESFTKAIIDYNSEIRPMNEVKVRSFTMTLDALELFTRLHIEEFLESERLTDKTAIDELVNLGLVKVDTTDPDLFILTKLGQYEAGVYFAPSKVEEPETLEAPPEIVEVDLESIEN